MRENPNYYAIITAEVRYSKNINANQKLLFAEITALSNSTGVCWASNNYFATLFDCTPQAISKWIKILEKNSFITCEYIRKEGSKEIEKRLIKGINHSFKGINIGFKGINTGLGGYQHTIKENITSINTINNNLINNNTENTSTKESDISKKDNSISKPTKKERLEKIITHMRANCKYKSKIKSTKDFEEKVFKLKNINKFVIRYIDHQKEKSEFSQTIGNFMLDYDEDTYEDKDSSLGWK